MNKKLNVTSPRTRLRACLCGKRACKSMRMRHEVTEVFSSCHGRERERECSTKGERPGGATLRLGSLRLSLTQINLP